MLRQSAIYFRCKNTKESMWVEPLQEHRTVYQLIKAPSQFYVPPDLGWNSTFY